MLRTWLVGLAALAFSVCVLFLGYFIGKSAGFWDAEANGYAAQYGADTQQRINYCINKRGPPSAAASCIEEAINAGHEERRAEQNLDAQRGMADWAWWLLIVTIGQTPITLVGILLLLRNIQQADAANEISRQALMAENRAWVEIVPEFILEDLRYQTENGGEFRINTHFSFRNIGKTVALQVGFLIDLIPDPSVFPESDAVERFKERLRRSHTFDTWPLFPDRDIRREWEVGRVADEMRLPTPLSGENPSVEYFIPALCIGVHYKTIFDKKDDPPHITVEVAMLRRMEGGSPSFMFAGRNTVPANRLALVRHMIDLTEVT